MKYIQIYENFNSKNTLSKMIPRDISDIILESFDSILQFSHFLNEDYSSAYDDPLSGIMPSAYQLRSGERAALTKSNQVIEDEQLFGAYLRAYDEYNQTHYVEEIPGIDQYKRGGKEEYISDLDLAIALNYESLDTFLFDKNKFGSMIDGNYSFANREIDQKRVEVYDLLKNYDPEEIITVVGRLVKNKQLPRILRKKKIQDPLERKNIYNYVQETIDQLKRIPSSSLFKTQPGSEKWMMDLATVINKAANHYNKQTAEILAIYQDEKNKIEKRISQMRGRPSRRY